LVKRAEKAENGLTRAVKEKEENGEPGG